jgi:hypothetical protein
MSRTFTHTVQSTPAQLLNALRSELSKQSGLEFQGDEHSGRLSGKGFAGSYELTRESTGTRISLTITKKPFIVPWGMIESAIEKEIRKW